MSTRWDSNDIAAGFDAYDDLPERTLGYPTVFQMLGLDEPGTARVLDYGCGPGKVARRLVESFHCTVLAVDSAPAMLTIAQQTRPHPRIDYQQVNGEQLSFLAESSLDAAMSYYVFINIGSLERIRTIVAEIYRVLRRGGRYAVLDTHPHTTGVQFSTFCSGEPGRSYARGQQRSVWLHRPGDQPLELQDYHWPTETYRDVLHEAGFVRIRVHEPLLGATEAGEAASTQQSQWGHERTRPPFLIVTGEK